MRRITLIIISLYILTPPVFGQYSFERVYSIPVTKNNTLLTRAWEGGLNHPICSNVDFNNNGVKDLAVFDKTGNRLVVFKDESLIFEPIHLNIDLKKWVLFRDYNCDGLMDIFTGTTGGIKVYKNTGLFEFVLASTLLQSDLGSFTSNLNVLNEDIPGIIDIDRDGDLDILTFKINGVTIEFHENISKNKTGKCGLDFKLNNSCWGRFEENPSTNSIVLNQPCKLPYQPMNRSNGLHAGSTITTLDQDKNGAIDLLLGDISFNSLTFLQNGGSNLSSNISTKDEAFPNYNTPVNINLFPYASYVDVNHDDKNDLVICSNNDGVGENASVHLYQNTGVVQDTFTYNTSSFLVNQMLDFGRNAYPIFVDENQDGLTDLLIGNNGLNLDGEKLGRLTLLRNTGSTASPAFEVIDENYLNFESSEETYLYPTIGDIDKDGDDDLLVGLKNGEILYYNNTAGAGNPYNFVLANGNFEFIDVGNYAAPQLFDLNKDGNLDLILGEQNGSLFYYENQSSTSDYDFSVEIKNLGNITTQNFDNGVFFGYSTPFFFQQKNEINLILGGESGKIQYYQNIENELESNIILDDSDFHNLKDGSYSKGIIQDLNQDLLPEIILGNASGGLAYHKGMNPESVFKTVVQQNINYSISNNELIINEFEVVFIKLYDLTGKLYNQSKGAKIELPKKAGVYYSLIELNYCMRSLKVIVQ